MANIDQQFIDEGEKFSAEFGEALKQMGDGAQEIYDMLQDPEAREVLNGDPDLKRRVVDVLAYGKKVIDNIRDQMETRTV
jgi:hypothetical protein